jgi:ATP-dependent DNA helicase UvrD/PcrA
MLRLITRDHRNVLAVGDPGQTIYAFRGASPEILTNFTKFFDHGRYMYLGMGYRSTQTITDYVRKHYPLDIPLKEQIRAARDTKGVDIHFQMFNSDVSESESAINAANRSPADSAILSRTNRGLAFAESYCRRNDVRYTLLGKSGFFKKPEVIKAVDKLKPYGRLPVAQAFAIVLPALENFYQAEDATPEDNFALENVKTLREIGKDFKDTQEFVVFANKAAHAKRQRNGITLSTVHQAKGCEWRNVYVIGASHGMMPHKNALEIEGGLLEEARVFMVAVSRPMDYLRISFVGMPGSFLRLDLSVEDIVRLQEEASTRRPEVVPTQGGLF